MTLREHLRLMRRQWWVVAVLILVGAAAASALTMVLPPAYVSQTSVLLTMNGASATGGLLQSNDVTTQRAATYASLGTSRFVLQAAAEATGSDVEDLEAAVTVTPRDSQAFLDVTATATTAVQAQAWSQAVAERLVVAVVQSDQVGVGSGLALQIVTPATLPEVAVSPRPRNNVLIGAAVGLILGVCIVVLRNSLDDRLRTADDVRRIPRVTSVVAVPAQRRRRGAEIDAARRESYRRLHATLRVAGLEAGPITVAGASATTDVRAATIGLGQAIASSGRSVVVVDIDGRSAGAATTSAPSPPAPGTAGPATSLGVLDVISGGTTVDGLLGEPAQDGVTVLASGAPSPEAAARLHSREFQRLVTTLSARFDCVLFSCPASANWSPTLLVAASSSSAVLVARTSRTTTSELTTALDDLSNVGVGTAHIILD